MSATEKQRTEVRWAVGSAYDLFASLYVLYHPQQFGVRKAWAAGVRARIPQAVRPVLRRLAQALPLPFPWVAALPAPRNAAEVLQALTVISPQERMQRLFWAFDTPSEARQVYTRVARRGCWDREDLALLERAYRTMPVPPRRSVLEMRLAVWAEAETFARALPQALTAYVEAFFAEEEERIEAALLQVQRRAQTLVQKLPLAQALAELTQGLRFPTAERAAQLLLAPSFWLAPLAVIRHLAPAVVLLVFGARPEGAALVPGAEVPDALWLGLRALAEPTRLRILRYLVERPHTPAELARRLRLRPPTVVHHLHALRLAGLVYLSVGDGGRHYAARLEQLHTLWGQLGAFLRPDEARD